MDIKIQAYKHTYIMQAKNTEETNHNINSSNYIKKYQIK